MNLISGTHYSCERREHTFMVLREYTIIFPPNPCSIPNLSQYPNYSLIWQSPITVGVKFGVIASSIMSSGIPSLSNFLPPPSSSTEEFRFSSAGPFFHRNGPRDVPDTTTIDFLIHLIESTCNYSPYCWFSYFRFCLP